MSTKAKLSNPAAVGAPEDQLRGPLEELFQTFAKLAALPDRSLTLVGESSLADLATRPDYAVTVQNALVGYIELKAPGKGADPRRFSDPRGRADLRSDRRLPRGIGNRLSPFRPSLR